MSMDNREKEPKKRLYLQSELTDPFRTEWAGQPVCVYESVDSTNTECTRLANAGAKHGTVVLAKSQTAGRGRRGRSWDSPLGENLYFSLLLKPDVMPDKAPMLTLIMALAAAEGIENLTGLRPMIKWPNDLVMEGKKICGILTEMHMAGHKIDHVVIGVGINVRKRTFPEELQEKAESLENVCGAAAGEISVQALLEAVLQAFEKRYAVFEQTGDLSFLQRVYNDCLVNWDREVTVLEGQNSYRGIARGINAGGELLVELADGTVKSVYAGEVSVRGIYGYV